MKPGVGIEIYPLNGRMSLGKENWEVEGEKSLHHPSLEASSRLFEHVHLTVHLVQVIFIL